MNIVWAKLAVILACTLAGDRGAFEFAHWGVSAPVNAPPEDDGVCHSSCVALDLSVSLSHAVAPTPLAATAWLLAALPTLLMRSRRRTMGGRTSSLARDDTDSTNASSSRTRVEITTTSPTKRAI